MAILFFHNCLRHPNKKIPPFAFYRFETPMTDAALRKDNASALTPYLILGFFVLLLALVVRAPASLLQKAVPASLPLQVSAWGGTVWNGQATALLGGENVFLSWRLLPQRLLTGQLALTTHAEGSLALDGDLVLGRAGWQVQGLRGEIPFRLLQPLLPPGWSLPGNVQAEQVSLSRDGRMRGPWRNAEGRLLWAGGAMQYNLGGRPQTATLPPLVAALSLDGDTLVVNLSEASGLLADVRLAADGTVETRLRERLLRYSNRTSGTDPDAVVVTSTQKPQ